MQASLLCEHLEPFLETWPTSGMTLDGKVYALPTREHHITGSEFSLLRTPVADETGGGAQSPAMAKHRGQTLRLTGQIIDLVEPGRLPQPLLPTSAANDLGNTPENHLRKKPGRQVVTSLMVLVDGELIASGGRLRPTPTTSNKNGPGVHGQGEADLRTTVSLLPTPTTQDGSNTAGPSQAARNTPPSTGLQWLLRTPVAEEGTKAPALQNSDTKSKTGQVWLSNQVRDIWEANND